MSRSDPSMPTTDGAGRGATRRSPVSVAALVLGVVMIGAGYALPTWADRADARVGDARR